MVCADCKGADASGDTAEREECLRTRFLQQHPETLQKFTSDLLPLLLQVYGSTVLDKVQPDCSATTAKRCTLLWHTLHCHAQGQQHVAVLNRYQEGPFSV